MPQYRSEACGMGLSDKELAKLRKACDALEDGPDYRCDDYVRNLMLTALDYMLDAEKVVMPSIRHFEAKHGIRQHAKLRGLLDQYPNTETGNRKLAKDLWGNNLWTRAKFLRKIMSVLEKNGIRSQA